MNMDCLVFALLRFMIGSGDSFHPLNQSDSNLQQMTTCHWRFSVRQAVNLFYICVLVGSF